MMDGLELFMELFTGEKKYYGMNKLCLKEPLTEKVYEEHVTGVKRIGVYPIFDKKWTKWAACDIDDGDFNKALSLQKKAKEYGFDMYIERSKSKGFHIFVFFEEPIEAVNIRLTLELFLSQLNFNCEVFPKQDAVEENQYGNFIFLPYFGGDTKDYRTVFIKEDSTVLIENIINLEKIVLTPIEKILDIVELNGLKRNKIQDRNAVEPKTYSRTLPCIEKIKIGVQKGHRNEAGFRLAISLKEKSVSREDIETLMNNWNLRNTPPFPDKDLITIINSVFKGNYKSYGCDNGIIDSYCDKKTCPIMQARDNKKLIEEGVIVMVFRDEEVMVFRKKDYEFRLSSFEWTKTGKFKCSLTLSKEDKIVFKDIINLSMASNRKRFSTASGDSETDKDLITIEDLVKKQIEKEEHDKLMAPKQLYIMTEQEKNEAVKFLESTYDILYKVINSTNKMGVVGEEVLRLMVYLCYTSRIMKDPLSITVKGESSSGKSFSCQNVQKLIPEEGFHFVTRITANAFFHLPEDGMQHRIIYINELPGSESADYSIRTAQSEGDLILMMPIKDPATGNMETITKKVKGPVGFLITTTKASMFDENETRNFSVFSDDSPKLTAAIGDITIRKAKGEEFIVPEGELNLWKNIQRLLNPDFKVIIPYAEEVFGSFPDKPVRIRRDRERFRVLIEIITILHQFHRQQIKVKDDGPIHLISTLADYYLAVAIAGSILTYTIYEIGPLAEECWGAVNEMADEYIAATNTNTDAPIEDFVFKYKDIAEHLNWKVEKTKKWAYTLLKGGLIDYAEKGGGQGGKGKASTLKISKIGVDFRSTSLTFLPEINKLYEKYKCPKELFYNPMTGAKFNPEAENAPVGLLE